jgi:hypothetical protein
MAFVGELNLTNVKSVIKRDWLGEDYYAKFGKYSPSISVEIVDEEVRQQLIAMGVKVWSIPTTKNEPPKCYVTVKIDYNDPQAHVVLIDSNGNGSEIHANTAEVLKKIWVESVDVHAVISSSEKFGKIHVNPYSKFLVIHAMSDEEVAKRTNKHNEDNEIYRSYSNFLDSNADTNPEYPFK